MTFKHIDFHDSSVMREFERQAIKSGKVSAPTVSEIVKNASSSDNKRYASTGELFVDLIRLAEGLREKGFTDKATSLENKIFAYKRASQEYNSELSAAHPDGDVTMGKASNGLGDVETLESAHKKMVDVINKKPTGKQAIAQKQLIANILKASEETLELKKKAQDVAGNESAEDIFSGRSATRQTTIKEINEFLASQFPKISSILKSKDVDPSRWVFNYSMLYNGTPQVRALYASLAELDPKAVNDFVVNVNKIFGSGFAGDQKQKIHSTFLAYAKNKDYNSLKAYANLFDPSGKLAQKYFTGSLPNPNKSEFIRDNPEKNNELFIDNQNSIWRWYDANIYTLTYHDFNLDTDKLAAAVNELYAVYVSTFNALFPEERLNLASSKIQEQVKNILIPWNEVTTFFEKNPELPPNITSIASLTLAVNSQIEKLIPYTESGALFKKLVELATAMWTNWIPNLSTRATEAITEISNTVAFLNSKPLSSGDIVVQDTTSAVGPLMAAAKMYWQAGKQVDPKSQSAKDYAQNQKVTFNLAKAVKANTGKPYASLYEVIKPIFPNATTYEKLVQEAQNWLQESSSVTGYPADEFIAQSTERLPIGFKKSAQGLVRKTTPAAPAVSPTPSGTSTTVKPTGSVGGRVGLGLAKANMNDPKEVAVAIMQQYLAYFAEALSSPDAKSKFSDYDIQDIARIVRTGPKANPAVNTYDGKWGAETQTALDLANKYLKQLGITGLDTRARYVNKATSADAEAVAKNNAALLSQGIQALGGRAGRAAATQATGANLVYDRLPDAINWSDVEYPLMEHRNPVTAADMASLGSLYDLITKHNWIEPQFVKDAQGFDIEGLPAKVWMFLVQWFKKRAQFVYNASVRTNKEAAALARQYYDAAKRLEGQLTSFFASHGFSSKNEGAIVDTDSLREYSSASAGTGAAGTGSAAGERGRDGQVGRDGQRVRKVPGDGRYVNYRGERQGEGMDWKSPTGMDEEGPPIGPDGTINLGSRWFNGLDDTLGISHNPLLNPEMFRRYSAADLARTFYASAGGDIDEQARRQALVASGVEVESYDEEVGDFIVAYYNPVTRRKQRTYAMKVPAYQKAYKAMLTAGPMRAFGALLQSISRALAPAIADWMRTAQPNDAAKQAEEAWHTEWQRILGLRANEAAGI